MSSSHFKILKYKPEWETHHLFNGWLTQGKNEQKAMCTACDIEMVADINLLRVHARGMKHCNRIIGTPLPPPKQKPPLYNERWEDNIEYKTWLRAGRSDNKAECSLCDIEMRAEKTVIRNHSKSKRHLRCLERYDKLVQLLHTESNEETTSLFTDQENKPNVTSSTPKTSITNITDLIVHGYKRLRTPCPTCDTTLMKNREGKIVCINCDELDGGDQDDLDIANFCKKEREISDSEDFGEVIMQINDEKYASDDDNVSVIHEVREKSADNIMKCDVQGVDIGSEIYRLICSLKIKLANLNLQLNKTDSIANLEEMESVILLLKKIKQL